MDIEKKVLGLIEKIYDAALEPDLWPETSWFLTESLGFDKCGIAYTDPFKGNLLLQHMPGWDENALRSIEEHYGWINPWVPWHFKNTREGDVYVMEQMLRPVEYEKTEYYNDFLIPHHVSNATGVCFSRRGFNLGIIEFQKENSAPTTKKEIEILELLAPHLTRAFQITSQFWELKGELEDTRSQLDRLEVGVILLDADERPVFLNRQAERIVGGGGGLVVRHKKVTASDVEDAERLRKLIHEAVLNGRGGADYSGGNMLLKQRTHPRPLRVLVCPIHSRRHNLGFQDGRICAAVFISAPGENIALPGEALQTLYGLTPAESEIALELAKGRSLDAIADEKGVTKSTARNQLKAVFHKTGTHRQNQLVNLLLTDPAAMVRDPEG